MACNCTSKPCACTPGATSPSCNPAGRGPEVPQLPANTPPPLTSLECTIGARLQAVVDRARRIPHALGYRPYRVRLVWQEQDSVTGKWLENASLELMPVNVDSVGSIDIIVSEAGQTPQGNLRLTGISPVQASGDTLLGFRDGEPWGNDRVDREFFYEIQRIKSCEADQETRTFRLVPNGSPELDADSNQWVVRLTDQFGGRDRDLNDQTVPGDFVTNPARLVP